MSATERMTRLLQYISDPVRRKGDQLILQKQHFDAYALLEEIVASITMVSPGHSYQVDGSGPVFITADRGRINQVMINMLTNAVKFPPASSAIDMMVHEMQDHVKISIRDRGIGLSDTEHTKNISKILPV